MGQDNEKGKKTAADTANDNPWLWVMLVVIPVAIGVAAFLFRDFSKMNYQPPQTAPVQERTGADMPAAEQGTTGAGEMQTAGDCDYSAWVGRPVNENAIRKTGRRYHIHIKGREDDIEAAPGDIHVEIDRGVVLEVWCE